MIVQTHDGDWVISSHGCWLPGVFEDERTARWAFRFSDLELSRLQAEANERPRRVILHADLERRARQKRPVR